MRLTDADRMVFTCRADDTMALLTKGPTEPVAQTVTHAGIMRASSR
jgi:hypothetical protein